MVATSDGQLDVKLPEEYVNCFKEKVDWKYLPVMGEYKLYGDTTVELDGCGTTSYGFMEQPEEKFLFTGTVIPKEANDSFGILLKSDWEASGCLFLEFDVAMQRVSLLSLPMGVDPFWEQSCHKQFRRQRNRDRMACAWQRKPLRLKMARQSTSRFRWIMTW
ncbi:MAG: hypothetical protein ACLR8P_05030 [Clostridium fessum]